MIITRFKHFGSVVWTQWVIIASWSGHYISLPLSIPNHVVPFYVDGLYIMDSSTLVMDHHLLIVFFCMIISFYLLFRHRLGVGALLLLYSFFRRLILHLVGYYSICCSCKFSCISHLPPFTPFICIFFDIYYLLLFGGPLSIWCSNSVTVEYYSFCLTLNLTAYFLSLLKL